jgi:chromate transport protein ChrA
MAFGVVVLVPGALLLGLLPFISAVNRMGLPTTMLFLVGIVLASIAFVPAYERLKPSSPPAPRRDAAIIVFSAVVIGLWAFAFSNEVIAILVLAAVAALMLLPEGWGDWIADHLPRR